MTLICKSLLALAFGAVVVFGQDSTPVSSPMIYPPPVLQPGKALRDYLSLSEAQATALQEVQKSKRDAEQAVYEQMRQKHTAMEALLKNNSNDFVQIGRLTVELRDLQKKLPVSGEPYKTRALAVLNPDQRTKLTALVNALQLSPAANEAVWWSLVDRPELPNDGPIILGLPRIGAEGN